MAQKTLENIIQSFKNIAWSNKNNIHSEAIQKYGNQFEKVVWNHFLETQPELESIEIKKSENQPLLLSNLKNENLSKLLIISIADNVQTTIINDLVSSEAIHFFQHTVIQVAKGASLTFVQIQNLHQDSISCIENKIIVDDNACCFSFIVSQGSKMSWQHHTAKIGKESRSEIRWISRGQAEQQFDLRAENAFMGTNSKGEIRCRSTGSEKSQTKFENMIFIGPEGNFTDSYMKHDTLLLSTTAKVNCIPRLEIHTNEVKASHGAGISQVDEQSLFYLESRGIGKEEAKAIMIQGFLSEFSRENIFGENLQPYLETVSK